MSSATHTNMADINRNFPGFAAAAVGNGNAPEFTERQRVLDHFWKWYKCRQYASRTTDWGGGKATGHLERETIASGTIIDPGFYDVGNALAPVRFRRPTAPTNVARAIVSRFTGLLFSARRHPVVTCPEDEQTDDWLTGFIETTRLWSRFNLARTYGGAMGSVAVGFKFVNGKPVVEVHDPRWCIPSFVDRNSFELNKLEIRYQFEGSMTDPVTGAYVEGWFWYRRVINDSVDAVWPQVPVVEGDEPKWTKYPCVVTAHDLGFVPAVWIQNTESQEGADGEPDCYGAFDTIEAIDGLYAQSNRGSLLNADPTLHIGTEGEFSDVKKGSDNAILTEPGGSASYLEISGSGIKVAMEVAAEFKRNVLQTVRCVLNDNFDGPARTEKETEQNYANMLERVDEFREQYGELGVKRLLELVLRAARKLDAGKIDPESGRLIRYAVRLPRNRRTNKPRILGSGDAIELKWPDFYQPSASDIGANVDAAGKALQFGIIDRKTAARFVADSFKVEDVDAVLALAKEEREAEADAMMAGYTAPQPGGFGAQPQEPESGIDPAPQPFDYDSEF